jgi:hypothetical protein
MAGAMRTPPGRKRERRRNRNSLARVPICCCSHSNFLSRICSAPLHSKGYCHAELPQSVWLRERTSSTTGGRERVREHSARSRRQTITRCWRANADAPCRLVDDSVWLNAQKSMNATLLGLLLLAVLCVGKVLPFICVTAVSHGPQCLLDCV